MKFLFFIFLFAVFFSGIFSQDGIYAQMVDITEEGPVHEALVTKVTEDYTTKAIPGEPPKPLNERSPKQLDMQAEWISGYWSWESQLQDFIWVSGVWRRPPPGHYWVSGYWTEYEKRWVWIRGYWSDIALGHTDYIGISPPCSIDENVMSLSSKQEFWIPGYWYFLFDKQEYAWVPGKWEGLDPNWVFIPSHYLWRPGGYLFIPAYWDWTLEQRGTAYSNVTVKSDCRYRVIFEPSLIVKPKNILKRLFPYYPDYLSFFYHHWRYNPQYWDDSYCTPSWWKWETWWCLTWHDHWGLWWWYSHPEYPQSFWMTIELTSILPPPTSELISLFSRVQSPVVVTSKGVISGDDLLQASRKITGEFAPILPSDSRTLQKVYLQAESNIIVSDSVLKPIGRRLPIDPLAIRPQVRKPVINPYAISQVSRLDEPLRLRIPYIPKIPSHRSRSVWESHTRFGDSPVYTTPMRRPIWTPRSTQLPQSALNVPPKPSERQNSSDWKPKAQGINAPLRRPSVHKLDDQKNVSLATSVPFPSRQKKEDEDCTTFNDAD